MSASLESYRGAALLALAMAAFFAAYSATVPDSPLSVSLVRRSVALDEALRRLRVPLSGRKLLMMQGAAILLATLLCLFGVWPAPALAGAIVVALAAPLVTMTFARRRHVRAVESSLATFALAMANGLRANPSFGVALVRVQPSMPPALAVELNDTLKDTRLGSGMDEALSAMSARVGSTPLDMLVIALLIGRQVGGNVSSVLETNAETLREMFRIRDLIRSKTAEGRGQIVILAVLPVVIYLGFDALQPGYFAVLHHTTTGVVLLVVAVGLWLAALAVARAILKVKV